MCKKLLLSMLLFSFFLNSFVFANQDAAWVKNALKLQRNIDINAPLNEATFIGTHNSYNSKAYQIPFVRYIDPNQKLSIQGQLDEGVRSIELDLHWTMSNKFVKEILLCHGTNQHIGCSPFDLPFISALKELRDWLKVHPGEIILLYLERHLDGHDERMAEQLEMYLGDFIFKPTLIANHTLNACHALPTNLTKAKVLQAKKQVIVVTKGCNQTKANTHQTWQDDIFAGIGNIPGNTFNFLDATITDFTPSPDCSRSNIFYADIHHSSLWRIYEERNLFNNRLEKKLMPQDMRGLMQCGINWPTMDKLIQEDERLAATIWSWAPRHPFPQLGHCASFQLGEGIVNRFCLLLLEGYMCQESTSRKITVVPFLGNPKMGEYICHTLLGKDWHFAVPVNAMQLEMVKNSMTISHLGAIWLNYGLQAGEWQPNIF